MKTVNSLLISILCFQVKLKDSLVSSLKFATAQDTELAWVDGQLVMEERGEKFDKMETDEYKSKDVVPVLEQLPPELVGDIIFAFVRTFFALPSFIRFFVCLFAGLLISILYLFRYPVTRQFLLMNQD